MNRRAIFFTLSAVLILLVVFSIFLWESESSNQASDSDIQYTKQKVTSDYMNDIGSTYLPEFVSVAEKFAMREMSTYVAHDLSAALRIDLERNLTYSIMTGHIDNNSHNPATEIVAEEYTLPLLVNSTFSTLAGPLVFDQFVFRVTSVEHLTDDIIRVNSSARFTLKGQIISLDQISNITWSDSRNYSDDFSLVGFYNIRSGEPITGIWARNSSYDCFLHTLDSDYHCQGFVGLCPFTYCSYPPP